MWPNLKAYNSRVQKLRGFTIVELLIVIVVIGILAAITIVAYNGIQQRAKESAARSAVNQAGKKVMAYAVANSDDYPTTLASVDVADSTNATFQYSVNNAVSPRSFCITGTADAKSYWISSTSGGVTVGGCPGHVINNGSTIANLFANPVGEGLAGWSIDYGTGGTGTFQQYSMTGSGLPSSTMIGARGTWSATSSDYGFISIDAPVLPNTTYRASVYGRYNSGSALFCDVLIYDASATLLVNSTNTAFNPGSNIWGRCSLSFTTPSTASSVSLRVGRDASITNGRTFDATGAMLTLGSPLTPYADGNTSGWIWTGAPNASFSTGPPL